MKAKVTGRSAWQGTPISGSLDVQVAARYVDSEGNASVSRYTGVLNAGKTGWANSLNTTEDLWLVVQGPDDPKGVRATFRETLVYADRTVTTEFSRVLRSSDLTGLIFDYAEPIFEAEDLDFGDLPLTMRAAQQVIEEGGAVVSEWSDIKVDIAQATDEARSVLGNEALTAITIDDGITTADGVPVAAGYVDAAGRSPLYVDTEARTHLHAAALGGTRADAAPDGSGVAWAVADPTGRMAIWVDEQGGVHAPALITGEPDALVCCGDSMTQGMGSTTFAVSSSLNLQPGGGYPGMLQARLSGVQVYNRGAAGQTAGQIAARVSGIGQPAQFGVGALSGGTYALRLLPGQWNRGPLIGGGPHHTVRGRLNNVTGWLIRDNVGATDDWEYAFTPDSGQAALEIAASADAPRQVYTFYPEPFRRDQPHIFWVGRNGPGDTAGNLAAVRSLLATLNPDVPRIIIGVLAAKNESWGAGREAIEALNREIAQVAGGAFFDPNDILCRSSDGSLRSDGTPNPDWMADDLHCNDAGYARLVDALYARITAERWYA